jgi:hypothetical protein
MAVHCCLFPWGGHDVFTIPAALNYARTLAFAADVFFCFFPLLSPQHVPSLFKHASSSFHILLSCAREELDSKEN